MQLNSFDLTIFFGYLALMVGFGIWFSQRQKSSNSRDYFLAGKSLPWWAVGGSLIASNISAEQMIGMAGSGFAIGLAIASYELMAAATLLVVAKWFMPIFIRNDIFTMPQFLEKRFDGRVRTGLAIFWVLLFVFVNVTSVLYLGGLAIENIMGIPLMWGVVGLALFAATFSIFGGLKVVVWTDVIQVVILLAGGALASYLIVVAVSGGDGFLAGLQVLVSSVPEKFDMIFTKDVTFTNIETGQQESAYDLLPGLSVLIGGMWIANLYYWGTNQYIIQRALAAKNIRESQKGIAFAAFLKVLIPLIVVIPGIAAFHLGADISKADQAYPWVLSNYVPEGIRGIALAALVAAIGSSLSSIVNSTATIYTLDIHKPLFGRNASESSLVRIGQITAGVSLVIGSLMTPALQNFGQIFQFIQEYTGFISPGILAVFILGLFWKKTTTNAAIAAIVVAIPLSLGLKIYFGDIPFINRMGISFLVIALLMAVISHFDKSDDGGEIVVEKGLFKTDSIFNYASVAISGILAVIYVVFW